MDGECPPIYPCLTPAGAQSSSPKDVGLLHWLSLPQPLLPRAPGTHSLALDFPTSTFTCVLSPLPQTLQEGCTKTQTKPQHSCLKAAGIPATAFKKSSPGPAPAASCYSEGSIIWKCNYLRAFIGAINLSVAYRTQGNDYVDRKHCYPWFQSPFYMPNDSISIYISRKSRFLITLSSSACYCYLTYSIPGPEYYS